MAALSPEYIAYMRRRWGTPSLRKPEGAPAPKPQPKGATK